MTKRFQILWAYLLSAAMLLAAGPAFAADALPWPNPAPITAIEVRIEEDHSLGFDWAGLARAVIRLQPGDMLTPDQPQKIENNLSLFSEVKSAVTAQANGVALTFGLRPFKRIKSIEIGGAYPLFEKDVLNAMTVAAGEVLRPNQMPEQEALVAQLYRAEGYVDPQVKISWQPDGSGGHYRVRLVIHKGPHYTLEKMELRGHHAMKEEDLLTRMSVYRKSVLSPGGGRFQPQDLKEDLRNLVEFYRSYGFAQVSITSTETVDPQRARVRSRLQIEEGPRYTVDFEGNHYFFDFRLRRDLVLFKSGNIGHTGLRRSAQNIRRRYLKAGFADVKVRWEEKNITVDEEPRVHVTMIIEEGPRHIVQSVEIRGNAHLDAKTLTAQMLTRPPMGISSGAYVADTLQEDLLAIQNLYRVTGFLNAHVKETVHIDPHSAATQVILAVDEGVQTRVGTISIDGQIPMDSATVLEGLQIKSGEPYTPANLKASENRLSAWISNLGYPHVRVQGRADISADQTRADVVYTVNSGPRVTVGQIFFLGNFRTQQRLMRRELDFDSGDPFLLQKVLEAQRDMRNLNIFDSVQVRTLGLKEQDKAVHLAVLALEKKPYYFEAAGGYQTDKGAYGRAKIGDHNFLGLGKDLSVSGEESQVGHRWEGNIADPRFLGTTIKSKAGVYTELSEPFNQDFGTTTAGANANLSYDWGQDFTNALSLRYERRQQYLRAAGSTAAEQDPEAFEPRTVSMLTPSIQYDSRDSFIQPRKGQLASLSVDISKGVENTLDDFLKYRVDLRHFHLLHPRVMLASHLWTGVIQPYNGDQPPQDQLFFLGGASTVRGFEENLLRYDEAGKAVGGRLALAASLETRISILNHFELIPFVDTGSVQDAVDDAGEDDFRWAMGLGLQYVTPIGPVGMFYGHKLDRRDGESSGQWHLSIGFTF